MAARTLNPAHVAQNFSESKWSLADDNAQDQSHPVAGDEIVSTANSGKVTCDSEWFADSLSATGASEWDFVDYAATLSGTMRLDDITATTSRAAATWDLGGLEIGANGSLTTADSLYIQSGGVVVDGGTLTLGGDLEIADGSLSMTSGEIADGGNNVTVAGGIVRTDGTLTMTGNWEMTSPGGDLKQTTYLYPFPQLTIAEGATANVTGYCYAKKFVIAGSVTSTDGDLVAYNCANGWWTQTGAVACNLQIFKVSCCPGDDITLTNANLRVQTNGIDSITMDANISLGTGDLYVRGTGNNDGPIDKQTLDMATYNLTCADVEVGMATAVKGSGVLKFGSGVHSIASLSAGNAANTGNEAHMENCTLLLSGTLDGDNITTTSAGANLHGGTIQNVTSTGIIHCWGSTDGGGNSGDIARHGGGEIGNPLSAMQHGGLAA